MSMQEQRKSFRCPVASPHPSCELKLGETVLSAQLLDESAGGFAVLVNRSPSIETNQLAQLHTEAGWYDVRIVHVMEVTPTTCGDDAVAAEEGPWFRLGIRRLGEAALPSQPAISRLAGTLRFHFGQWCPSDGIVASLSTLLVVVLVAVTAALVGMSLLNGQSGGKHAARRGDQFAASTARGESSQTPPSRRSSRPASERSPFDDGKSSVGVSRSSRPATNPAFTPSEIGLRETVRHLPTATALTLPEVAKRLRLTAGQQEEIRQIIDATAQAMRDFDQQWQGQQRQWIAQFRTELSERSQREAIGLLTKEQLGRWKELAGQ